MTQQNKTKHKNNRQKGDQDKSMAAPSSRPMCNYKQVS